MKYEKLIAKPRVWEQPRAADPDAYDHAHAFCDILVIGAGPAGLMAALTAPSGKDVLLVEQDFELGGDLLNCADDISERRHSLINPYKSRHSHNDSDHSVRPLRSRHGGPA